MCYRANQIYSQWPFHHPFVAIHFIAFFLLIGVSPPAEQDPDIEDDDPLDVSLYFQYLRPTSDTLAPLIVTGDTFLFPHFPEAKTPPPHLLL